MRLRLLSIALLLAACNEVVLSPNPLPPPVLAPPAPPAADVTACGGTRFMLMVGSPIADLQLAGLPGATRIIRPGDAVTMDYNPLRLNAKLDARDRVTSLSCG